MTTLTSVDKITDSFPQPTVTAIHGEPTYETLTELARSLKANAASIDTELGGGDLGHLALTVSTADYATFAPGTPFDEPDNPGPMYIAGNEPKTGPVMIEEEREHREELRMWNLFQNTDKALKLSLIHI